MHQTLHTASVDTHDKNNPKDFDIPINSQVIK